VSDRGNRKPRRRRAKPEVGGEFDQQRGVFMISVAAELAEMHPQTLRMYEARGLIVPKRSAKNTRLYSFEDVERLRRIQRMTAQEGLNLAGVETVLDLERQLQLARRELGKMRDRAAALERQMLAEIERVKRSFRAELVPYGAYDAREIVPATDVKPVTIPVERPARRSGSQRS
jgi:MerR family transcriptional regulator, heat shock protein HspR